ncbi:MAG: hypothetical protein RSB38_04780 [Oscillospiraceae bacterium]
MAKPILYKKNAFDATKSTIFSYAYTGAQQFKVSLKAYDSVTSALIYSGEQTHRTLDYTLPANSLTNGKSYNIEVTVYDKDNVASETANKILIICFLTPTFSLNISNNQIINNSIYSSEITYSQITGELLDYFVINLMDLSNNVISTSGNLYPLSYQTGEKWFYLLTSLLDNTSYRIQATGKTVNGMDLSTGIINFSVEYTSPAIYSKISLENIESEASVKIQSNYIAVEGRSSPSPPTYINNEEVDLTARNSLVEFTQGYSINNNFSISLNCRNLKKTVNFLCFFNAEPDVILFDAKPEDGIFLKQMEGIFDGATKVYFVLSATNGTFKYRVVSNLLNNLIAGETYNLEIKKKNNLYSIKAKIITQRANLTKKSEVVV